MLSLCLCVRLSAGGFNLSFTATGCTRDATQTVITCGAAAGVGAGLHWTVDVAGQRSPPSTAVTSYPPPQLYSVTGVGAVQADTQGGQSVTLTGFGFGPTDISSRYPGVVSVSYGRVRRGVGCRSQPCVTGAATQSATEYTATDCVVSYTDASLSTVSCVTAPGIGTDLVWQLSIAGLASNIAGNTSYGRPVVSSFAGDGFAQASTEGNQPVYISGKNFGPLGTVVTATYSPGVAVTAVVPPSAVAVEPTYYNLTGTLLPQRLLRVCLCC